MTKIAINGLGRIGRNVLKILLEHRDAQVIALNDFVNTETLAHLLKHDSIYGSYEKMVSFDEKNLIIGSHKIPVFSEKTVAKLPWVDLGVDVVIDTIPAAMKSGATAHLQAGAKKVILTTSGTDESVKTIVLGANEENIDVGDVVISGSSYENNCVAPIMQILADEFGIEKAMITTVNPYDESQKILDTPAQNLRRARGAAENIIPVARENIQMISGFTHRMSGLSVHVPIPIVALSDITAVLARETTKEELIEFFTGLAGEPYYEEIIGVSSEELVSSDFIGDPHSCIIDLPLVNVVGGNMVKIVAWCDNEWSYANRLAELALEVGRKL